MIGTRKWSAALAMVALVAVVRQGSAADTTAPAAAPRVLGRDEAMRLGATSGPGVAVAAAPASGIGEAAAASRALLPRPGNVTISAGQRSGDLGGGPEISATAIFDVPLKSVGGAREASVRSLEGTRDADLRRARLDAAARAGAAWSHAVEAKLVLHLRGDSLLQAESLAEYVRRRAKSGTAQPIELALAEGDLGSAESSHLDAEGMLVDALAELRLATGLDPAAPLDPDGELCATNDDPVDEATAMAAAERDNPDLQLASANARLAGDEVRLVSATLSPSIGLGASFTRDGFGDRIVSGVVVIPLPFSDPGRFEAGRARIAADVASARVQKAKHELESAIHVAIHDREHTRELRHALGTSALPPLREALRVARAQVDAGTQDVALALLVRQRVLQAEEQYAHACGEVQRADLRYLRLLGRMTGVSP